MSRLSRDLLGPSLVVLLLISACGSSPPPLPKRSPQVALADIKSYAALGDSFTAGPSIKSARKSSGVCGRSTRNYPTLLAKKLKVRHFRDVSCAGASAFHIEHAVPIRLGSTVPAQKDALDSDTDLVTIGIGYNEEQVFGNLSGSCLTSSVVVERTCKTYVENAFPAALEKARIAVGSALLEVREQARHARVVLVGYLPLLPEVGTCGGDLFTPEDEQRFFDAEQAFDAMLRKAADAAGTDFVSMREAAKGHGACAGDRAWVNDASPAAGDGVIFHPRAVGMAAVADAIEAELGKAGQ